MSNYDDIINLEYKKSPSRKHMTMTERAAQFGAFKAVVGHEDALEETARLTDRKIELDEDRKLLLNEKLIYLCDIIDTKPVAKVTYFVKDELKDGGAYKTIEDRLIKIKEFERVLVFENVQVPIQDIISVESDIIDDFYLYD